MALRNCLNFLFLICLTTLAIEIVDDKRQSCGAEYEAEDKTDIELDDAQLDDEVSLLSGRAIIAPLGAGASSSFAAAPAGAGASSSFAAYYKSHNSGRGMWKWNHYLEAYQRHFKNFVGQPLRFAEIGVQSGGSIEMWSKVLGADCHYYGIDINPQAKQFENPKSNITIGDQADTMFWQHFFSNVTSSVEIVIDDGGHTPSQMLVTLLSSFEHVSPGGIFATEDIHWANHDGPNREGFLTPAAAFLGFVHDSGLLASIHIYPFLHIIHRSGGAFELGLPPIDVTVSSFTELHKQIPLQSGGIIAVQNEAWGSFLSAGMLTTIFDEFAALHDSAWYELPDGCATKVAAHCSVIVRKNHLQETVVGVHVYKDKLIVEVADGPVELYEKRMGTEWLPY